MSALTSRRGEFEMITESDIDSFENGVFGHRQRDTSTVMTRAARGGSRLNQSSPPTQAPVAIMKQAFLDDSVSYRVLDVDGRLFKQVVNGCGCVKAWKFELRFERRVQLREFVLGLRSRGKATLLTRLPSRAVGFCVAHRTRSTTNAARKSGAPRSSGQQATVRPRQTTQVNTPPRERKSPAASGGNSARSGSSSRRAPSDTAAGKTSGAPGNERQHRREKTDALIRRVSERWAKD